jgi:hypothetical protein
MADLFDVLIEAQTDLDWCADPSDLERALVRLVDLESRDDVAIPLQQKIAQLKMARELGRVTALTDVQSVLPSPARGQHGAEFTAALTKHRVPAIFSDEAYTSAGACRVHSRSHGDVSTGSVICGSASSWRSRSRSARCPTNAL